MASLIERLKKNSRLEGTAVLSESTLFGRDVLFTTSIPMLNVALSGQIDQGMRAGILTIAGPSKHFKSMFALLMAKAWMDEHPNGVLLFYDSEFGSPISYFESYGIDTDRVLHGPITNIEKLKFDLVNQLEELTDKDEVMILIDSIGNTASKKELDDAINESSKADMSRAKALKGLFRMITPSLAIKNIPLIAINHTYKETGMFGKTVVSGGTGVAYSSNYTWILSKRANKDKGADGEKALTGYDFVIRIEKSRDVREGSLIPITVSFDGGVDRHSGLLDVALKLGYLKKVKIGNKKGYQAMCIAPETDGTEWRKLGEPLYEDQLDDDAFWQVLFDHGLAKDIRSAYKLGERSMFADALVFEESTEE